MIDLVLRYVVPQAFSLLPVPMISPAATAMLLAIGLQESRFLNRRQSGDGPARGFWQFEAGGVAAVLNHRHAVGPLVEAAAALRYRTLRQLHAIEIANLLEHNDVLAAVFARCLLWTLPRELPQPNEPERAWSQYIQTWRPGDPHRESWDALYLEAWARVEREGLREGC